MNPISALVILGAVTALSEARAEDDGWEKIRAEKGITVWQKDLPGTSLVAFRGRTRVQAPLLQVAAVVRGVNRHDEWMESCSESRAIRATALQSFVYQRIASDAPLVSDRDVVLDAFIQIEPDQKTIWVRFADTDKLNLPAPSGVVRMARLKGYFKITAAGEDASEIEYQVEADPGGWIPGWLVNVVSKRLPFETLKRLRNQVYAPGYEQDRAVLALSAEDQDARAKKAPTASSLAPSASN